MSLAGQIDCSQFRYLVQRGLDGFDDAYKAKQSVMNHRESCPRCEWFVSQLSQLAAVCVYISPPDEFLPEEPKILASRVLESLDVTLPGGKLFHFDDNAMEEIFRLNLGLKEAQKVYRSRTVAQSSSAAALSGLEGVDSGDTIVLRPSAGSQAAVPAVSAKASLNQSVAVPATGAPVPVSQPAAPATPQPAVTAGQKNPPPAPTGKSTPVHLPPAPVAPTTVSPSPGVAFPVSSIPPPPSSSPSAPENGSSVKPALSPAPAARVKEMGRIDNSKIEAEDDQPSGRIAAIGKFLLDAQDFPVIDDMVNRIENSQNIRLVTVEAAATIYKLQEYLSQQPGISGSMLLGHDGSIISSKLKPGLDVDAVAIWSLCSYLNSANASRLMGHDRLQQVVSKTAQGFVVIINFGEGLLITLIDGQEAGLLVNLMRKITGLINVE